MAFTYVPDTDRLAKEPVKPDGISKDTRLRQAGFQIVARPKKGPTLWKRGGIVYDEAKALQMAGISP